MVSVATPKCGKIPRPFTLSASSFFGDFQSRSEPYLNELWGTTQVDITLWGLQSEPPSPVSSWWRHSPLGFNCHLSPARLTPNSSACVCFWQWLPYIHTLKILKQCFEKMVYEPLASESPGIAYLKCFYPTLLVLPSKCFNHCKLLLSHPPQSRPAA